MSIHRAAPLAIGLIFAPCAFAQAGDEPPAAERHGSWNISASAAAIEGAEFTYNGSNIPDLVDINYTDTTDAGLALEASLGHAFANGLRTEIAITQQKFDGAQTKQKITFLGEPIAFLEDTLSGGKLRGIRA